MTSTMPTGITAVSCRVGTAKGIVKAWVLQDGDTTVLVDTGQDATDAAAIRTCLSGLGIELSDVSGCLLTHRHGDHVGGLASLAEQQELDVRAHPADRATIEGVTGVTTVDLCPGPLEWLPNVEVLEMPGHTPGSVALYWHSRKALIAGDSVFSAGRHLVAPPAYLCDDAELARRSIADLVAREWPIEAVLVGHGEDVYEEGQTRLRRIQATQRDNNG